MDTFEFKKSPNLFYIHFDPNKGYLQISGKSTSENPKINYEEVMTMVEKYVLKPAPQTTISLDIEYANSSSSRYLLNIFRMMEEIHLDNKTKVTINWFYEEDDEVILGLGEDMESLIDVPFNITMLEE